MDAPETAQAVELIRALRAKLDEMTVQLAVIEDQAVTTTSASMASALRLEAVALHRDIAEALVLISRLQRRYPSVEQRPWQRRPRPKPRP